MILAHGIALDPTKGQGCSFAKNAIKIFRKIFRLFLNGKLNLKDIMAHFTAILDGIGDAGSNHVKPIIIKQESQCKKLSHV
jgi:hypothetical protein